MISKLYETLCKINETENVLRDEPMSRHTTFRIGGPAAIFCRPGNAAALSDTVQACLEAEVPYSILGNGSNVLVSDEGFPGVVIQLFRNMDALRVRGGLIEAEAGALLARIAHLAAKEGLTGLEFASGIPGTLGGALVMNAGAYGGEMKDVVREAVVMKQDGELLRLSKKELELGYRSSIIAKKGYLVLSALLELEKGDPEAIETRMKELKEARLQKQPLEYASAGSTFKRPQGHFAGKLIMDAGLRGYTVGGAQVSEKHCGFVINRGGATAGDVLQLVKDVQKKVQEQFGVDLELEVKLLPSDPPR